MMSSFFHFFSIFCSMQCVILLSCIIYYYFLLISEGVSRGLKKVFKHIPHAVCLEMFKYYVCE